ncbi:hypothetical protein [Nocardioides houyundeii]|uniref:hypothetical protein n=1 Tax=Nocardioides houyundeii TaxID=2045452 RepID=UPI000C78769D|nr:hypothetical protein [Nocardioides houyundeii]
MTSELLVGNGSPVQIEFWRTGTPEVTMELSLPTVLRGNNFQPAAPAEVIGAVQDAYDHVNRLAPWLCPIEELTVARIDLARDFSQVADAPGHLARLAERPGKRMRTVAYYSNTGVGVETVIRYTDRHVGRLYDRAAMYAAGVSTAQGQRTADDLRDLARAERGVVRFELQLRSKAAEGHGIKTLHDVCVAPLPDIAHNYFQDRCRFDAVVAGGEWKIKEAVAQARRHGIKITAPLGQLMLDALNEPPECSAGTLKKYRALANKLGVAPVDLLNTEPRPPMRLDFNHGLLVPGAAEAA